MQTKLRKALGLVSMIIAFMPAIPRGVRPIFLGVFLLLSIIDGLKSNDKFKWSYFLMASSLYVFYLLSLTYTSDLEYGLKKIGTAIPLLLFPLAFAFMSKASIRYILDRKYRLMWCYIIATTVLCVGAFITFNFDYSFSDSILHYVNIIRSRIYGWKIHPIYLSMHIAVSLIMALFIVRKGLGILRWFALILISLILLFFLMIMIKKGPIIALILVGFLLVFLFNNNKLYIVFGLFSAIVIGTITLNPKVNKRFTELLQVQDAQSKNLTSTSIRYSIFQCAEEIIPEAGFFGFGIGDGKSELINCFEEEMEFLAENKYNSHNQYLGLLLKVGYLGLFFFALFLIYYLVDAFRKKNYILVALILFYALVMLAENILERENGVLFFSFFVNLFIFTYSFKSTKDKEIQVDTSISEIQYLESQS
ncbi:O-antigen ligase family protein [Nonlabens xiamenensis]|uniref:O-antigen ligase family protein n=1 Tax=Nonlabens xiamenensis TaxID=2341043 RepID=UPI000F610E19|nr:O-antigen ligase family protein [Nonlabens xiamenensis]